MNWKNKGITLCLVALIVLTGVLVYQGVHNDFPSSGITSTYGAGLVLAETPDAIETMLSDESAAELPGAALSGPEQKTTNEKEKKQTTAPAGKQQGADRPVASSPSDRRELPGDTEGRKNRPEAGKEISDTGKITGTPVPAMPTAEPATDHTAIAQPKDKEKKQASLLIQCASILSHRELWKEGIEEIIPPQGIFYEGTCELQEGDTAYDLLKRICKGNDIALDCQYTPLYGTYYIRGIGNLYEFDCGDGSGWKYSVNGKLPGEGCSSYHLENGDNVVFFYDYEI